MFFLSVLLSAAAEPMITFAQIATNSSELSQPNTDENHIRVRWPFCPSYPDNLCKERMWVDIEVHLDGYIQRRNASHESWYEIIQQTKKDVKPLAAALQSYYKRKGIKDMASQAGIIQGMIQAVHYAYDNCDSRRSDSECNKEDATGWTEYPKYGLEFIVDQKGDCEDAAIISSSLFENVGMEAWFVDWNSQGGSGGHASTALTLAQGNLTSVSVPKGSQLIKAPKTGTKLLSADSVGSLCTGNCYFSPLGWNEWGKKNLYVNAVFRPDDKSIEDHYSGAWKKEGGTFTRFKRDRRKDTRQKIKQEIEGNKKKWDSQTRKRLKKLNEDPDKIPEVLATVRPYRTADDGWVFLIVLTGVFLGIAAVGAVQAKKRRKRKVAELKKEKQSEEF